MTEIICSLRTKNAVSEVWIFLPVAQRFPLGFTLSLEILFLSSVTSRVIADIMAIYEIRMNEDRNPPLQIFVIVPITEFAVI